MADWANNWQNRFSETGASGLNLVLPSTYTSLLRSEIGARFFETLVYNWGYFVIQEKISYINQTPFSTAPVSTFFIGSPTPFSITTNNSTLINQAGVELNLSWISNKTHGYYGSIDLQGQFGSVQQSFFASCEVGKKF